MTHDHEIDDRDDDGDDDGDTPRGRHWALLGAFEVLVIAFSLGALFRVGPFASASRLVTPRCDGMMVISSREGERIERGQIGKDGTLRPCTPPRKELALLFVIAPFVIPVRSGFGAMRRRAGRVTPMKD
jgi:hypothetical protein